MHDFIIDRGCIENVGPDPIPDKPDKPTSKTKKIMQKAKNGNYRSCNALALLYLTGKGGFNQSRPNALIWFEAGAKLGSLTSMYNTAYTALDVEDLVNAKYWFQKCIDTKWKDVSGKLTKDAYQSLCTKAKEQMEYVDFTLNEGKYAPVKSETKACGHCSKEQTESFILKACKCHAAFFCNKEHQKLAWTSHKTACKLARAKTKQENKEKLSQAKIATDCSETTFSCEMCTVNIPQSTNHNEEQNCYQQLHLMCCGGHICKDCWQKCATKKSPKCPLCKKRMPHGENEPTRFALKLVKTRPEGWLFKWIGAAYEYGNGCVLSPEKAFQYNLMGAEVGNTYCQFNVAIAYSSGHGVKRSGRRSLKWYKVAAANGHASAQYNVGNLLYQVSGDHYDDVKKDIPKTIKYWKMAAEQNHPWAQAKLGLLIDEGFSTIKFPDSLEIALDLYKRSAENGNQRGQFQYGFCLISGINGPINYAKGIYLIQAAAKQGDDHAIGCLANIRADMKLIEPSMNTKKDIAAFMQKWNGVQGKHGLFKHCRPADIRNGYGPKHISDDYENFIKKSTCLKRKDKAMLLKFL